MKIKFGGGDPKNPKIAGAGKMDGGKFDSLTISGSGKVDGDVEAKSVQVSGSTKIDGSVKAVEFEASGSLSISGGVEAERFVCKGAGNLGGDLKAGRVEWRGACKVDGGVEADEFSAKGGFAIAGDLSAKKVDIVVNGRCEARKIKGGDIVVKLGESVSGVAVSSVARGGVGGVAVAFGGGFAYGGGSAGAVAVGGSVSSSGGGEHILDADSIEGDDISLEATRAKKVKGKRVTLGAGCEIETVEYSASLKVEEGATVKNRRKM